LGGAANAVTGSGAAAVRRTEGESMHVKEGLKLVFGSVVVYVAMAACASGGPSGSDSSAANSSSGGNGSDGSGSSGGGTGDDGGTQAIDVYATTYGVMDATAQEAASMTGETGVAALVPVPDAALLRVPDATVDAIAAVPDTATDAVASGSGSAIDAHAPLPESGAAPVPDAMVDAQDAAPPIYCVLRIWLLGRRTHARRL
jgi:hypothetical protein